MKGLTLRQAEAPYLQPPEFDAEMIDCPDCIDRRYGTWTVDLINDPCLTCDGTSEIEYTDEMRRDDDDAYRAEYD